MAASNPNGEMQFWNNGLPFGGVQKSGNDGGEMQFWNNGLPYAYIFPASVTIAIQDAIGSGLGIPFAR